MYCNLSLELVIPTTNEESFTRSVFAILPLFTANTTFYSVSYVIHLHSTSVFLCKIQAISVVGILIIDCCDILFWNCIQVAMSKAGANHKKYALGTLCHCDAGCIDKHQPNHIINDEKVNWIQCCILKTLHQKDYCWTQLVR